MIDPEDHGGTYEFRKPVAGISPFFVGAGLDNTFAMLQIDNIPDLLRLNTNIAGKDITFHAEDDAPPPAGSLSHVGDIDIYVGPAPTASDSDLAARVIMKDVPDDVHIFWDFGFPSGSANFTASNEFGLLFLAQDGGNRIVGALQLQDLQAGYNITFDPHFSVGTFAYAPTSLDLVLLDAVAGIDNDVNFDGGGAPIIGQNTSKPGVDGFFNLYRMKGTDGDDTLDPVGPAPAANEYVPELTFMMKDFREFSYHVSGGVHIFGLSGFLTPFLDDHGGPTEHGDFMIDVWAPKVDISIDLGPLGSFGLLNPAGWSDNGPIHLVPFGDVQFTHLFSVVYRFDGFHLFGDHFDPFA